MHKVPLAVVFSKPPEILLAWGTQPRKKKIFLKEVISMYCKTKWNAQKKNWKQTAVMKIGLSD